MSVFKRNDGRWVVEVYSKRTGKMQAVSPAKYGRQAPKTRREAIELERLALRLTSATDETCESFARRWTTDYPVSWRGKKRGEATLMVYDEQLKPFIERFGERPLANITRHEARLWANEQPASYVSVVRAMYGDAQYDGLVPENPFSGLGRKTSRGRADIQVLTPEEVEELAECAVSVHGDWGVEFGSFLIWQAYTCMRPGETFAARWRHLDGDTYSLEEQWHHKLNKPTAPKYGSIGTIFVPPPALQALTRFPRRIDDDLLFRSKTGLPLKKGNVEAMWQQVRAAFGSQRIASVYELRHAGASYMLNTLELDPWVIAKQLRHSDGGHLALRLYSHAQESEALRRIRDAYSTARGDGFTRLSPADRMRAARDYPF